MSEFFPALKPWSVFPTLRNNSFIRQTLLNETTLSTLLRLYYMPEIACCVQSRRKFRETSGGLVGFDEPIARSSIAIIDRFALQVVVHNTIEKTRGAGYSQVFVLIFPLILLVS